MLFAAETYNNYNRAGIQYNALSYDWGIGYIPLPLSVIHPSLLLFPHIKEVRTFLLYFLEIMKISNLFIKLGLFYCFAKWVSYCFACN